MTHKFSVTEYIKVLGDELISAFAQGGLAPTPGIKGRPGRQQYAPNCANCYRWESASVRASS